MKHFKVNKEFFADLYPIRFLLLVSFLLYVPITFLNIVQPLIIGYAVQEGALTGLSQRIYYFSGLFFLSLFLLAVFELVQNYFLQKSGQQFIKILRNKSFVKVQKLSMSFLDNTQIGKILTRLINDPESLVEVFSMGAIQVVGDFFFLSGTLILLFFVDVQLSLYSFLSLPILIVGMLFFRYWTKIAFIKVRAVLSNLNSFLAEYLMGNSTVQMFNRLTLAHETLTTHNKEFLVANKRAIFLDSAVYSFVDSISYIACAFVLLGGHNLQESGALKLGILIAFIQALNRFFQPIKDFSSRYAMIQSSLVSLDRIYEMLSWPEENHEVLLSKVDFNEEIKFDDVSFSYQSFENVLKNVSFTLKKGQRFALVGRTGAGKSTIIKLINRFYSVTKGKILIDGQNIENISLGHLRKLITVVPQEVFLFRGNLRENLCFGKLDASDEEIWRALRLVQLNEVIVERGGLNCFVDNKGQNFSQGEKQLLSFARAIIADYPIVILDEATANVDIRTESRLKAATESLLQNRTAIIIAHRLSTIEDCDQIILFEQGKIIDRGTHQELMEKNSKYYSMIREQEHKI